MSKSFSKRLRLMVIALFSCVLIACLVFGLSACGSSDKNKAEMTLGLNHTSYTMAPGDKDTLEVYVTQSDGKEYSGDYVWYSSDETIVSVTDNREVCIVEAKSVGTARVTCEVGNYTVFCSYNVVEVTDISFEPESLEVEVGSEESLKVTVSMSDNTTSSDFTYGLSGDDGVVEISKTGSTLAVKGVKTGSTTLTVTAGGKTASCEITVVGAKSGAHVHVYGDPQWTWSSGYSTAEAVFTCTDENCPDEDGDKTITVSADVELSEEGYKAATCGEAGSCRYVATAKFGGETYTDTTADVEIPATGLHTEPDGNDGANVVWSWETSSSTPTADVKITCSVCGATLYDGTAQVSPIDEGYVAPGCETTGTQYYEGTVSFVLADDTHCSYTDRTYVTLGALGHTYPDSETQGDLYHWTFPEGEISVGTEVTIAAECVVCHQTIETFTTTITSVDTVAATAENNGSTTYTAVVEIEDKNVTLTFVEIITAEGHTYPGDGDTTYVVWGWGNMDTESQAVSYTVYCADGDNFTLYEGTATYSYVTTNPTCDVAGGICYKATATVSADGTTHTYSGTYSVEIPATGHDWTAVFLWEGVTNIAATTTGTVQVELTCSNCNTSETLETTYTRTEYVASTCNDAGHMTFTATLNVEGVDEPFTSSTTVTLPLSEEHTYPEDGSTNVVWDWENRNETDNTVKLTVYCTVCGNAIIENVEVNYVADQSGTYWVATYSDGTHTYTGSYLIPQEEDTGIIVEVDFNSGSFETGQTFVEESTSDPKVAPGDAAVVDKEGNETGFTAVGTASDSKTTQISASAGYTYLAFNGSASTTKNSVSFYLEAGIYKVEISYFSGGSGRWATVLDSSGKDRDELIAEEDKTSGSGEIKTRTIYLPLDAAQNIYIGSKSSGLYVTFIGVYKVEAEETKTVIGVSLDESSTQLEMGSSMVISAMAELSDGKHYLGYTGAEYSWDISGDGSATYTGSGDNISVTGQSLGQVVVTVTINGTYSAYCEIEIIEKVVYDITSLTIDFSDSDTYSWVNSSNSSNDYSYWIVTLVHGWNSIGSGRLNTGGGSSANNGRYFILDLSEYMGQTLTITVDFESAGTSSGDRSICLDTQCSSAGSTTSSTTLAYATSNISGDRQKLEYSGIIENEVLYLTYSGNINIYSIEISIDSGDQTVMGVTLSSESVVVNVGDAFTITADVRMNFGTYEGSYVWEVVGDSGIVETDYSAGETTNVLTVTAVGEGSVTITLTIGDFTASCKVTVYPEGESIYETVTTVFDYATPLAYYGSGSGPSGDSVYVQGIFTVSSGARFYDGYINTQGNDIIVTMSGIDNTISFTGTGASSSANPLTVSLYKDGEDITPNDWSSVNLANSAVSGFYVSGLGAGTYTIKTSASVRIENLTVTQSLPVSDPDGIIVTAGNVDFLKGRNIGVNDLGLNIILHYENGREDPLTVSEVAVAIDSDLNEGAHAVTVTYHYDDNKGNQDDFSETIYIYIYSVDSITISDFSMEYTGGTYYTNNVQKIFLVGDGINYDYAAVTATASCTYTDAESGTNKTITKEFILTSDEVYFSTDANMDVVGTYTVTATADMGVSEGDAKSATYQINVVTKEGADITTVMVDQTAAIGMDGDGVYTVNTINDAIMLIKLLGASDKERKFIYVAAGQYWEKIYIDIPNLSLIGANSAEETALATRQDSATGGTEIVYWAFNGLMDPSGTTTFSTVGSATVTVAKEAVGFYAANITFRNYWNTNDLYNECKEINSNTQADAAYINADQSNFYNVTFTGYHDTLEAENGRQVYDHCYIEGRTDYIFGSTATCYFKDCTIHSIGAGTNESNGGYVVAYKGNGNAGTVDYGYIFDGCTFEGDDNVKEHSVALGRAWGEDMMMVIMNSTFDSSFAMGGYTGASSALRYCQMNYNPDFSKIFEYNNTGDSAIDSTTNGYSVDGNNLVSDSDGNPVFTIPTDPTVYSDMSVIFATTNGTVSYGSAWDGKCEVIAITVKDSSGDTVTTIYATGSMSVSDLKGAINLRLSDNDVETIFTDSGMSTELSGSVTGNTTVYISLGEKDMSVSRSTNWDFTGGGYGDTYVNGYLDDNEWLYLDCGNGGSLNNNGDNYILQNGATIKLVLRAGSVLCVGTYFEESVVLLDPDGIDVTSYGSYPSTGANKVWPFTYTVETAGEYTICAGSNFYLCYINVSVSAVTESTTISFRDTVAGPSIQGGYGWYGDVYVDATASGAKFVKRNSGDVQTAEGTVLYIQSVPGATASINWYPNYSSEYEVEVDETGLIKITIGTQENSGGAYIYDIVIVIPTVIQIGEYINFKNFGSENNLNGASGTFNGIIIDATNGYFGEHNNGDCVMVNAGTVITIYSVSGATAELDYYSGYSDAATIVADENGVITITFTTQTYLYGITIVSDDSAEDLPGEEQGDVYTGSITLTETDITVTVGETGNIEFECEVLLNGEIYDGSIDIAIESDDTYIAVDSWDGTSNTIVVKGVNEGETVVNITLSVNGAVLDTVSVTIHVVASAEEPQITTKEYSFSYEELCNEAFGVDGTVTDKTALDADYFTGSNAFLTYTGSYSKDWSGSGDPADNIRTSSCIEVKGDVLEVAFEGTGTISISFASTGNTNISTLGLRNEAGYYLQGILVETSSGYGNTTEFTISYGGGYYYKITNTSYVTVEFVITEPGTYTIATSMEATVLKLESSDDNRASRINSIVMIDNMVSGGTSSEDEPSEHTYPDANDSVHVIWDWEGRTETSDTTGFITVTIVCVDCGETIVSEQTSYIVDPNNDSYWFAEVSENNTTYSSMYRIPGEGSVYVEENFIVPVAESAEGVSSESFAAGAAIVDNSLFTLTAVEAMQYSAGTTYGNISAGSAIVTFTDMSGTMQKPDQGIQTADTISANGGTKDNILEFTANNDIHAYIYVSLGDNGFTGNRSGEIFYSMDGVVVDTKTVSARNEIFYIELDMQKGQSISIGATNNHASSTGKLWLWGAEAYTLDGEKNEYGEEYTVTFNTNQTTIENITTAVFNYSVVSAPVLPNVTGYYFAGWYMNEKCSAAYDFSEPVTCDLQLYAKWVILDTKITYIEGAYESIAFEFTDSNASGAKIYYKLVSDSSYTLMNDPDAVRQLDAETVRVDIIGLQGNEYYNVKILTSGNDELACRSIYVASYDRSGYAHFGYDEGVGAYEDDGTLKDGALVIYLTEENKNDVTNDMFVYDKATDSYNQVTLEDETLLSCLTVTGSSDKATYFPDGGDCVIKGIGEILNTRRYSSRMEYGIGKLCQTYGAVVIRVVGEVKATIGELHEEEYTSTKNGATTTSTVMVGSYDIVGISDYNYTTNGGSVGDNGGMVSMTNAHNVTIEGVGEGATINGWGFCFMTANGGYDAAAGTGVGFEVRNLTFKNYTEDAIGMEGVQADSSDVNSELTCPVERLWIHNNTFYVGYCANPVEEDKADGDGSCDFKRGRYLTVSYNYFEGCHKTNLFGANANSLQFDMTIHHNYYCNCSQRMPLVRNGNVHFYNNYIYSDDGNMQSAVYSRDGAFVYAEYNYFEGCYNPMMAEAKVSDAGSDEAGYIKSFGNVLYNCTGDDQSDIVTSRTQTVENTCNYPFGNIDYSSFDTDPTLFYYDVAKGRSDCYLTSAAQAKKDVIREAGAFGRSK